MAQRLASYRFRRPHPWDEWMDGSPWRLTRGEDFECSVSTLIRSARRYAADRDFSLHVRRESEDVLVIQAER